jgi:hypothetical protein
MGRVFLIAGLLILLAIGMAMLLRPAPPATVVRALFHQMARWTTAAEQDKNPVIANLHANYGVGYMLALKDIARDDEIERILGVGDLGGVFAHVTDVQNVALLGLVRACPAIAPKTPLARYGSQATM